MTIQANDIDLIISGLQMRRNYIETGDPILSKVDCINMRKKIKVLSDDQLMLISQITDLIERLS